MVLLPVSVKGVGVPQCPAVSCSRLYVVPRETPARYAHAVTRKPSEWTIHSERVVDDSRRAVLSIADVELPDGIRFEQYVLRLPAAATVVVLDDSEQVLMMHRHRFIINRWVWELPGGYLDPGEDPAACAAREVEEETGWRPRTMELLLSFQPAVGTIGQDNLVYLARGGDPTGGTPDINEAEAISWIPLAEVERRLADGEIVGAGSVTGLLAVLLGKGAGRL
jgi:8-oxo-dGTP pyrophosphatase MutT (NUDIX family)